MTIRNNLWPRFAPPNGPAGKISNPYRAFFSRFRERIGPAIIDLLDVSPPEDQARAVNELLAEMRAQNWIDPDTASAGDYFSQAVRAVCLIPAATEFGYGTTEVIEDGDQALSKNGHAHAQYPEYFVERKTDILYALDDLEDKAPNCKAVSLFVTWFGDDLRAGHCTVKAKVERQLEGGENPEEPYQWRVGGMSRSAAEAVSTVPPFDRPAYGGTPADRTIVEALTELRQVRGLEVTFTPFLLMDVPAGNGLPDPYTLGSGQPVNPWRGRITCYPAPGVSGTPDKTPGAAAQVANFLGAAQPGDFFISGGEVIYGGPPEWSYRRMILHYAHLCAMAGGIDVFAIGSEMRGLTWVRDSATTHPFVEGLRALAADVKSILPNAKVIYAADWSEYHSYQPPDGSGDFIFHLDPLWGDANIDAIGIDCYFPLSDWRDGETHLDYLAGHASIYDIGYLQSNVFGGEGYEWYYASQGDRDAQIRTDIADGAYGKPWVFRYKDLPNWWSNRHFNRIAGVEQPDPTAWTPKGKPIWFTELGCPAVDKGANQPNVFVDPLSSESAYPYYSSETRDDLIQRRYNHAMLRFFDASDPEFAEDNNPASDVYDGRMVDLARLYLYTWDARPYFAFPELLTIWIDGVNWQFGHWLTGRIPVFPVTQDGNGMAPREVLAPQDPYLIDPATGKLNKRWRDFLDGIGYIQGEAIANVPAEPSSAEIAAAINAMLAVMRKQRRIAG